MTESAKFIDRSNPMQQRYREQYFCSFILKTFRFLERHKKRLEEISKRKTNNRKSQETDISIRLNDNKKQIHEVLSNCKLMKFIHF